MLPHIPTHEEASDRIQAGNATPLDFFVFGNEPAGREDEAQFRHQLEQLLQYQAGAEPDARMLEQGFLLLMRRLRYACLPGVTHAYHVMQFQEHLSRQSTPPDACVLSGSWDAQDGLQLLESVRGRSGYVLLLGLKSPQAGPADAPDENFSTFEERIREVTGLYVEITLHAPAVPAVFRFARSPAYCPWRFFLVPIGDREQIMVRNCGVRGTVHYRDREAGWLTRPVDELPGMTQLEAHVTDIQRIIALMGFQGFAKEHLIVTQVLTPALSGFQNTLRGHRDVEDADE